MEKRDYHAEVMASLERLQGAADAMSARFKNAKAADMWAFVAISAWGMLLSITIGFILFMR